MVNTQVSVFREEHKLLALIGLLDIGLLWIITPDLLTHVICDAYGTPYGNWEFVASYAMFGLIPPACAASIFWCQKKAPRISVQDYLSLMGANFIVFWIVLQLLADKLGRGGT